MVRIILLFVLLAPVCRAQGGRGENPLHVEAPLAVGVQQAPSPVTVDGQAHLVYEIRLTSFSREPLCLGKLEVIDPERASVIAALNEGELKRRFSQTGAKSDRPEAAVITSEGPGLVYLELIVPRDKAPRSLTHRVSARPCGGDPEKLSLFEGGRTPVASRPPAVLGAPLRGGPWAAVHDPAWARGHRRVAYTAGGTARIPGRFAIDFFKLDEGGRLAAADRNLVKNWYGYDADVLAVADGVVSSARDDFAESPALSDSPRHPPELAAGNYVSLKLAENRYVFYEHLRPGSVLVRPGQRVKKGAVIARVGFTGQSTGPHLHLHVADADSSLGAEGLPFVFDKFVMLGAYPDFGLFGKGRWQGDGPPSGRLVRRERPAARSVISFD